MTDDELKVIEARDREAYRDDDGQHDVPALVAEVRRLRSVIDSAEWSAGDSDYSACPWCGHTSDEGHAAACDAFPNGPAVEADRKRAEEERSHLQRRNAIEAEANQRHAEWERTTTPESIVASGGALNLCHCRVWSKSGGAFLSDKGYCRYCGGWQPEVIERIQGRDVLDRKIDDLARSSRDRLRQMLAAKA